MAETQNQDEPILPTKRKLPEEQNPSLKSPKLTQNGAAEPKHNVTNNASDDDNDDDDYNLEESEEENPKVVDKKGKGILMEKEENSSDDDVSDEDDDVSDESDDVEEGGSSDSEEEDPLAEVDLENILPSRTRRKVSQHGVCIKDGGVDGSGNDA